MFFFACTLLTRTPGTPAVRGLLSSLKTSQPNKLFSSSFLQQFPHRHVPERHTTRRLIIRQPIQPPRPTWIRTGEYERFERGQDGADKARRARRFWVTVGTGTGVFGWYYASHLEEVPVTGRRRFVDVTPRQEKALAKQAYGEVMAQFGHHLLPQDHRYSRFVRQVASRLIEVSGMAELDWEVHVVNSPQKNAFVLPGGKIFVFTGILPICHDEDGLAAVLGHEISHQLARHSAEKLSFMKIILLLQVITSIFVDPNLLFSKWILDLGILLPFSRKCEVEADQIGLLLMAQACYNPDAAIGVWVRMAAEQKNAPFEYLSTHPGHETRIKHIQKWLPDAEKKREESNCHEELPNLVGMFQKTQHVRW